MIGEVGSFAPHEDEDHSMRNHLLTTLAFALGWAGATHAADDPLQPRPVPVTRPAMKQALEDLKEATPRVPPPELTASEKVKLGNRAATPEARIRARYLPPELTSGEFSRDPDPNMTLDYAFKTMLFWIVSRVNNCHY
jgi:hypothetical protein